VRFVREVRECGLAEDDVFELPIVLKMKTDTVSHRPVVGFALDQFGEGSPLGMALNTCVVRRYPVHLRRIEDVASC
jgi:hypothetical protein